MDKHEAEFKMAELELELIKIKLLGWSVMAQIGGRAHVDPNEVVGQIEQARSCFSHASNIYNHIRSER